MPRAPDYSNMHAAVITAQSPSEKIEWTVDVENVINPFFSAPDGSSDVVGSPNTRIRVFTNDRIAKFTSINVTILGTEGGGAVESSYSLQKSFEGNNETDWSLVLTNVPYGNIYIAKIAGFDNLTKNTLIYNLGTERAHYRSVPQNSQAEPEEPEEITEEQEEKIQSTPRLVYVTFEKDVLGINDTQTITLDAKNFNGGVSGAEAVLLAPDGELRAIKLGLIRGNSDYGTWSADFSGFVAGPYTLNSVNLASGSGVTEIPVTGRNFYVVDGAVGSNEVLMLVYSVMSHSTVKNGTNVTFRADARDFYGIESAQARVKTSRLQEFTIPMKLVKGNGNYGTWEGIFEAASPDTTYMVTSLTLKNSRQSKTYEIKDRSVYVLAVPSQNLQGTGFSQKMFSKEWFEAMIRKPLVPTLLGFGLMFLVIGTIMMTPKAGKRMRKYEASKAAEIK